MDIHNNTYDELKAFYDNSLNKDKSTFASSNDEPTPIGCIEEMFSKVPEEFFNNAHSNSFKALDPCCGNGNFSLVLRKLLLERGLDEDHILNNVLYFNDINTTRTDNVKRIFGEKAKISNDDFLQFKDTETYDLIMANPPYAKLMENGKRASKNHNLVKLFIEKSLRLLKENGIMIYIVPDNWMSLSDRNTLIKELTRYQFHWLDIHNAKRWFPKIGSSFTWFVLEKKCYYKPFVCNTLYKKVEYKSQVDSGVRDFIPLLYTGVVQSILSKTVQSDREKFAVETSSDLHKFTKKDLIGTVQNEVYPYKLIHTPKQTVYAKRPHKYQEGYKVFISTTDKYATFVDNCGMTQSIAFIPCSSQDEARAIKGVLDHNLYRFLNDICRWGNFNNVRILQKFPKTHNPDTVYEELGLNEKEVEFIEKISASTTI